MFPKNNLSTTRVKPIMRITTGSLPVGLLGQLHVYDPGGTGLSARRFIITMVRTLRSPTSLVFSNHISLLLRVFFMVFRSMTYGTLDFLRQHLSSMLPRIGSILTSSGAGVGVDKPISRAISRSFTIPNTFLAF